ncbi:MAG: cytochrome c3 family protein [Candidatus Eisenbacteria bacterium]
MSRPVHRRMAVVLLVGLLAVARIPSAAAEHVQAADDTQCSHCHFASHADGERFSALATTASHPGLTCGACHVTRGITTNLHLVRQTVATPSSGTRTVVYTAETGAHSLADGDATYDGLCEVCHTATFRHANSAPGDHRHHAGLACTSCHTHENGFAAPAATCKDCHDHAQPQPGSMYRRQAVAAYGTGGEFMQASHHVLGATAGVEAVTAGDCVACHSTANHGTLNDGVSVDLRNTDTGGVIRYNGTPASAELACVRCHDDSHVPFSTARTAKNTTATWTGSLHQARGATCMRCHGDGHGNTRAAMLLNTYVLTDNTSYVASNYNLCWGCHTEAKVINSYNHFADLHKKHTKEKRVPCYVCHDNHGPYDAGERGLINFAYAQSHGTTITFSAGRTASTAFYISADTTRGYCYMSCHGKNHNPQSYSRTRTGSAMPEAGDGGDGVDEHPTDTMDGSGEGREIVAFALQNPSRGSATFVLHAVGARAVLPGRVAIYDLGGRLVRSMDVTLTPTRQYVRWDGLDRSGAKAATGLYLCRFESERIRQSWRVALIR